MKKGVLIGIIAAAVVVLGIVVYLIFAGSASGCSGSSPNECNGQCYLECGEHYIFKCDASAGGLCAADPNNCPPDMPYSCKDTCWSCPSGQTFECNASIGGTCKSS
jgi:hypothetical protein